MKKRLKIGLFLFALAIFLSNFVSAQETNFDIWTRNIADIIANGFSVVSLNPAVLTTFLLGALLWIIIYSIVVQIFKFKGTWAWLGGGIVSLIIVLLTFIYIPDNFIEAIALQYSAMGATILTVLPFILLLYFTLVVSANLFVARVIWIFYVVYYFALFAFKVATAPAGITFITADNLPYIGAIIAGIIILIYVGWMRGKVFEGKLSGQAEQAMRDVKIRGTERKIEREEAEERGIGV